MLRPQSLTLLACSITTALALAASVPADEPQDPSGPTAASESSKEPSEKPSEEPTKDKEQAGAAAEPADPEGVKEAESEKQADAKDSKAGEETKKEATKKEEKEEKAESAKKKRSTHKVATKKLKVEVTVDGTFVAREMTPVTLDPESWSTFKIKRVAEHGARVRRGESLIEFDDEDLLEAIADLELEQRLSEIALRKAEEELPRLEKSLEMSLIDARQEMQRAEEDYKEYKENERAKIVQQAEMRLKQAKFNLDYYRDELAQLEKMYEADDLTEETEEIILARSRQEVEFAEFSHELAKYLHEQMMSVSLPRYDTDMDESLDGVRLALERAELASATGLNQARYELEQQRKRRQKALDRHAELLADKGLMSLESPADGLAYYGQCINGAWGDMGSMIQKLQPEKTVPRDTVLMTIVDPSDMFVLASVGEKAKPSVRAGQATRLRPTYEEADPLKAEVESVSVAPISSGKFELRVKLTDALPEWVVPGMTTKVHVTTYENPDALVIPKKGVHAEEDDETSEFVWLVVEDGDETRIEKRIVKTGKTKGDDVEVTSGLKAGDVVSLDDEAKADQAEDEKAENTKD